MAKKTKVEEPLPGPQSIVEVPPEPVVIDQADGQSGSVAEAEPVEEVYAVLPTNLISSIYAVNKVLEDSELEFYRSGMPTFLRAPAKDLFRLANVMRERNIYFTRVADTAGVQLRVSEYLIVESCGDCK